MLRNSILNSLMILITGLSLTACRTAQADARLLKLPIDIREFIQFEPVSTELVCGVGKLTTQTEFEFLKGPQIESSRTRKSPVLQHSRVSSRTLTSSATQTLRRDRQHMIVEIVVETCDRSQQWFTQLIQQQKKLEQKLTSMRDQWSALQAKFAARQSRQPDVYWQYYADCDRWHVVFATVPAQPQLIHNSKDGSTPAKTDRENFSSLATQPFALASIGLVRQARTWTLVTMTRTWTQLKTAAF